MSKRTHRHPGRAGCARALRTSPRIGVAACKSRATLNVNEDSFMFLIGYHRCHGEARHIDWCARLKSVLEASVRIIDRPSTEMQRDADCLVYSVCWDRLDRPVGFLVPERNRSALPGVKPTTYSIKGSSRKHGNLNSSARSCEPWQAAKSSDVSNEGRSLRSSPSAGKPRTWRREAVDACS